MNKPDSSENCVVCENVQSPSFSLTKRKIYEFRWFRWLARQLLAFLRTFQSFLNLKVKPVAVTQSPFGHRSVADHTLNFILKTPETIYNNFSTLC